MLEESASNMNIELCDILQPLLPRILTKSPILMGQKHNGTKCILG
jgi:hypothetical protein